MRRIASGVTDQYVYFKRQTGLSSFTVNRVRNTTSYTEMTTPTVTELGSSGTYALLLDEDMTIGGGNLTEQMAFLVTAAGMSEVFLEVELTAVWTPQSGDNFAIVNGADGLVAISAQIDGIGAASGGALNFANSGDNVDAPLKSITFEGSEDDGTNASVSAEDGTYHDIGESSDNIDIVYEFNVGGGRTAVELVFKGYANGNGDDGNIQVYNGSGWDVVAIIEGKVGSNNDTLIIPLLSTHTGTDTDLGKVWVRIEFASQVGVNLLTDQLLVSAVNVGQSVGYSNGQVSIDTVNGVAGTESFVNGVADNPTNLMTSGFTIAAAVGLKDFHIINGSAIVIESSAANKSFFGDHWTLDLSDEACGGIYCQGATVSGAGTSDGEEMHFEGCDIGTATVEQGHFDKCGFTATLTMNTADDYEFHGCYDKTSTAAVFTKTDSVNITAEWVDWSGSITISGIQASSSYIIAGTEIGDIILNGDAAGTVEVRGIYKTITDNRGGGTLTITGAVKAADIADILVDTAAISTNVLTQINAALDAAISELGVATPTATPSLRTGLMLLYMAVKNVRDTTATSDELHNDAGTKICDAAISDDGVTFTKAKYTS